MILRRYLQRTQVKATPDDKAWSIIGHLEGEARNDIIKKAASERETPEKVFELQASWFGTGGNRMQVRQAFASRYQLKTKTECSIWTPWKGYEARDFLMSLSVQSVREVTL